MSKVMHELARRKAAEEELRARLEGAVGREEHERAMEAVRGELEREKKEKEELQERLGRLVAS